jgi:hypothetical protein
MSRGEFPCAVYRWTGGLAKQSVTPVVGQFRSRTKQKLPAQKAGGRYKGNPYNGDTVL